MKIAVNTRFLLRGKLEGIGWFTYEIIRRMVINHPEHEFIFFFDRPFAPEFIFEDNVKAVVLQPPARHPILWFICYEWSVRRALKREKADLFISTDGFLSLGAKVPSILVLHDLAFEKFPEHLPFKFRSYLRYFTPKFAKKANAIVTVSHFSKSEIEKFYQIPSEKITVIYNGANHLYRPLGFEEKQSIKEKYAQGCEYFVFAGALHPRKNIGNLLKAFALFKRKQRSNMKLLVIGRFAWNSNEIKEIIEQHPYKEDVIQYDYMQVEELSQVIGAAYALTFVSLYEGFGIPVLEALNCNVPVIAANGSSLNEVAGDCALFVDPNDIHSISHQMCVLYKEEGLRKELSEKCSLQASHFSWDRSALEFYNVVKKIMP